MHSRVFQEFERLCSTKDVKGSVLEVGAIPSDKSLLCMKSLTGCNAKIGINLNGPFKFKDFTILKGNANNMSCFDDDQFDLVLCNAMLEHDKYFWKTIAEIKRVTKPGGLIILGTPGYEVLKLEKIKTYLKRMPVIKNLIQNQYLNFLFTATMTYQVHEFPGDYYRFSQQTFREIFFDDMDNVEVYSIMLPPRIIGIGNKKA